MSGKSIDGAWSVHDAALTRIAFAPPPVMVPRDSRRERAARMREPQA